ncbi:MULTISPECIES: hypothetical protein [Halorubrum]|uniref:Uncharacterized protein n=1 Tax=Halorubrum persicum TaxID=1383844 RepID=A0A2G1WKG8_9EURY|nr:hypothetical protein [Halorubrum persicum]OYR76190.1 hypothetical protein DJ71_18365 [Halorubrum sp. E3]PHQ39453.1 hypothetical protein DJ69_06100 [Halorubrum persicum]
MPSVLQVGLPGGPELFVVLFLAAVVAVPVVFASLIIYLDAVDRNSDHALAWTVAALFGGVVVWTLYVVVRDEVGGNGLTVNGRL